MDSRLFARNKDNFLMVNQGEFFTAAQQGNSAAIDAMLAMRANGAKLDIDAQNSNRETALEIALKNRDFINARKLLRAGAKTVTEYRVWVHDENDCYPYGGYETRNKDLFESFARQRDVLAFLVRETDRSMSAPRFRG